jgi:hypothetical protein
VNRLCDLCASYHSAKNYRREQERCAGLDSETKPPPPPIPPLRKAISVKASAASTSFEDATSSFRLPTIKPKGLRWKDHRQARSESDETSNSRRERYMSPPRPRQPTLSLSPGAQHQKKSRGSNEPGPSAEIIFAPLPAGLSKAPVDNTFSRVASELAVDLGANDVRTLAAVHNMADAFLTQGLMQEAESTFDNVGENNVYHLYCSCR